MVSGPTRQQIIDVMAWVLLQTAGMPIPEPEVAPPVMPPPVTPTRARKRTPRLVASSAPANATPRAGALRIVK